jgi:hypothetical protein
MDVDLAVANLKAVKSVFDKLDIKFWLLYGTALGAVRDGKIMEWDHDIDIGLWNYDRAKLFMALSELRGNHKFTFISDIYPDNYIIQIKMFSTKGDNSHQIDFYLWDNKGPNHINPTHMYKTGLAIGLLRVIRHYLYSDLDLSVWERPFLQKNPFKLIIRCIGFSLPKLPLKAKSFAFNIMRRWNLGKINWVFFTPRQYFDTLDTIQFYGLEFNIPSDVENFLKINYGENWRIPKKKWDWITDNNAKNWTSDVRS